MLPQQRRKPGRPRIFDDPVSIKLYLERGELDSIEILAHINGNSISRELRLAVQRHLAVGLDDSNTPTRTELAGRPGQGAAA